MKKILLSLLAVAALASCSKMTVEYEAPQEIGFKAVAGNMTKASGLSGSLATTQKLGIWAFWDKDGATGAVSGSGFSAYEDNYLVNALFSHKNGSWGGSGNGYPWPANGALVFSGYTTPGSNTLTTLEVTAVESTTTAGVAYDFANDKMYFTNYDNTSEFDLCWFGRTASSYNYRADGTAVPVTLSHALSWISIDVYGTGTPIGNWTITSMTLKNAVTKGTATCEGAIATWEPITNSNINVYTGGNHVLTAASETEKDGNKIYSGVRLTNNLVIPSLPVELTVNYSFLVNGVTKTDSKTVSLKLNPDNNQNWQSGIHYIYTLNFKGNEILVAPSYGVWTEVTQPTITVE